MFRGEIVRAPLVSKGLNGHAGEHMRFVEVDVRLRQILDADFQKLTQRNSQWLLAPHWIYIYIYIYIYLFIYLFLSDVAVASFPPPRTRSFSAWCLKVLVSCGLVPSS